MSAPGDRALALCLLLPGALLAWPFAGAPLLFDPYPHLAGSAWIALASLPAVGWAAWTRRVPRTAHLLLLALCLAAGAVSALLGATSDAVELRRAAVHGAALLGLFGAGSALGPEGRATFARGLVALSLVWLAGAFGDSALAGVLGNTGALSQAALPGAVGGAVLAALGRGPWRALGAAAAAAFAVHAGRAPVLAGILAAGVGLVAAALLARAGPRTRLAWLGAALCLPLAFLALRAAPAAGTGELAGQIAGDTGGGGVRLALWSRVPALLADRPLLGVGPGQLQAAFPPYRDPAEIAASAHGSCADHATEVDHLHNDALEGLAELGVVGGLAWLAFLALCAREALRSLRAEEPARAALGAAGLALLANALLHSPLLFHPASAAVGLALLGALAGAPSSARSPAAGYLLLVPALAAAWSGLPLIVHGRALSAALRGRAAAILSAQAGEPLAREDAERVEADLARALAELPASVPALLRQAEWVRVTGGDAVAVYERVLAHRPYDLEAHQQVAFLALTTRGDVETAREHWQAALALDPGHPRILRNLVELELDHGEPAAAHRHLDALEASGCLDQAWLEAVAARLLFLGRGEVALDLLARADARFALRTGGAVMALSRELEAAGHEDLAYGLESAAHHLWAREHAALGSWSNAVRSYRQALRPTHSRHPGGATLLRLELAATQALAGEPEEARNGLAELGAVDPAAFPELPDWARAALLGL